MRIEEVLNELRVHFLREGGHHHSRPGWLQLDCPFCGSIGSGKFHFGINLKGMYGNCWKCGGHSLYSLLVELGLDRPKVREITGSLTTGLPFKSERTRSRLVEPGRLGRLLPAHREYLRSRGFKNIAELEKLWEIKGISLHPSLAWRIYIPIVKNRQRVSWTTRAIGDVFQRYRSASAEEEAVNHKTIVYGRDFCYHSIIIVEGPLDAWRVGPGAGALFGTSFSLAQVEELSRIRYRYICFDSSHEAQTRACRLAEHLSVFPGETHFIVLDAEDPGSASPKEIKLLRKIAKL